MTGKYIVFLGIAHRNVY